MSTENFSLDGEFCKELDRHSLETIVAFKVARFLEQIGAFCPSNLHELIVGKAEKSLLQQVLYKTGGNQLRAAKLLGINRNTLRKKIALYGL